MAENLEWDSSGDEDFVPGEEKEEEDDYVA